MSIGTIRIHRRRRERILAKILAEQFVIDRNWSEQEALHLGRRVLRGNVEEIFNLS